MRSALRSVIVAAALALSWPAYAARITVEPSFGLTLSIRGEIAAGDGAVARALIGTKRITTLLLLSSPGGNLDAALEIIALLKLHGPLGLIEVDGRCVSACGLIALLVPSGQFVITTRSRIGLHQVRRGDAPDPESTATMAELMRLRGLPEAWIVRMKAATPDGMAFITIDELRDGLPAMVLEFSQL